MTSIKERESTSVITSPATASPIAAPPDLPASDITIEPNTVKVGRLRRVGGAIARHPRITQTAVLLLLATGTGCFLLYSLFKGAWSPHQDNIGILTTIFKMELNREDTRVLEDDSRQVITRSYQSLEPYVAEDEWVWVNRFGSTITYGRQDQRLIASCSAYSPLYMVCSLSEIP